MSPKFALPRDLLNEENNESLHNYRKADANADDALTKNDIIRKLVWLEFLYSL